MTNNDYPDALPTQHRLHWYVLERVLGQGGFGITYLARDTNLDQAVAIKEYLPVDVATRRPDATVRSRTDEASERFRWGLDRFLREARTLARFDHSNVVRVLSVFEFNDTAYMVMRFEEGETMAAMLDRRHALTEEEILRIMEPVLDGLELVHGAGFIHRDIKPDNIHIRADGSPVLLDFGSARHALGHSRTVTILVAPGYAPFEQYYSSGENQGPWTDIYSLAATCYRAIAGHPPLDAIARSKGILGSTREMLLPASVVGSGRYSEAFLRAIDHALEFGEKDRPQSIDEWRRELRGGAPAAKTASATAARAGASPPKAHPVSSTVTPVRAGLRPVAWAGLGAAAALAIPLGFSLLQAPEKPPAREAAVPVPLQPATVRAADGVDELRKQLAALKQDQDDTQARLAAMLQQKREEEDRARTAEARARPVPVPVKNEAPVKKADPSPGKPQPPANAAAPARSDPPPQLAAVVPAAPAEPQAPTATELIANSDRAYDRGNAAEAAAILKPLAERGDVRALVRLGDLHLQGEGVEHNDQEALRLFQRAAAAGSSDAQVRLGDMYAKGRSLPQNNFHAYVWYSVAARAGNGTGKMAQERLATQLQAAELQQAKKLVDNLVRTAPAK